MKAAIVIEAGKPPIYGDFKDPVPVADKKVIRVTASAITHLTKGRASGTHYSSADELPFIPGVDGTGIMEDGRRVYFLGPERPYGGMAEFSLVDERHCIPIPDELSDDTVAAMANPGMSSSVALIERAKLRPGETVLINGATGTSGRLAIQIAKHLGARKVVATGRQTKVFNALRLLGADVTIPLIEDKDALEKTLESEFRQGIDVVLDYLWGPSAEALIVAAAKGGPEDVRIRYVQVGSMSAANITLPSAALRSSGLELMGSGLGSVPFPRLLNAIQGILEAAQSAGFRIAIDRVPLGDVTKAWAVRETSSRIVLIP